MILDIIFEKRNLQNILEYPPSSILTNGGLSQVGSPPAYSRGNMHNLAVWHLLIGQLLLSGVITVIDDAMGARLERLMPLQAILLRNYCTIKPKGSHSLRMMPFG